MDWELQGKEDAKKNEFFQTDNVTSRAHIRHFKNGTDVWRNVAAMSRWCKGTG